MSGSGRTLGFLAAVLLAASSAAFAQKVDVVRLKNGDRITCEITGLTRSVLTVSTDPFGKISVHWGQIEALESPRTFNLQLATGEVYFGSLGGSTPNEVVVNAEGGASVSVPLSDVVQLVPIGRSFWRRVDGSLDAGFSFTQANLDTRATLNGSATYRSQQYRLGATWASQVSTREDADREYRADLSLNASRYLSRRWYLVSWGAFQQNDELALDLRLLGGGGFGRELVHSNRRLWSMYGGIVYTTERYTDEPTEESVEAALGGQVDFFSSDNNDYTLTNRVVTYVNTAGRRRVRVELQTAWRQEFLGDFYWSLNGFESFDSDPPADQKPNDAGVSFTIGWKF